MKGLPGCFERERKRQLMVKTSPSIFAKTRNTEYSKPTSTSEALLPPHCLVFCFEDEESEVVCTMTKWQQMRVLQRARRFPLIWEREGNGQTLLTGTFHWDSRFASSRTNVKSYRQKLLALPPNKTRRTPFLKPSNPQTPDNWGWLEGWGRIDDQCRAF